MRVLILLGSLLASLGLGMVSAGEPLEGALADLAPPLEIRSSATALNGIVATLDIRPTECLPRFGARVEIRDASGAVRADGVLDGCSETTIKLEKTRGDEELVLLLPDLYGRGLRFRLQELSGWRSIPGWLSLLPPLLAIVLALAFRQVVPALLAGVWVGAWLAHGGPLTGALRAVDHYLIGSLADRDHASILVFSLMLGGMVGIMARAGGTVGLVERLAPHATNARRGQVVTWLLGILVFFDDYANSLLVGNTMRPVTDRLRISREKLAYIVDSTAAPVASIALISTWIGYEVSLIADALREVGSDREAYAVFLQSIPYNFYPVLALALVLMIAASGRDFGPMLRAEKRAATRGKVLADTANPLADFDVEALEPAPGKPRRWFNAVIPVLMVLTVTFCGLWWTGRVSLAVAGDPLGTEPVLGLGFRGVVDVFTSGDSFKALLWASSAGAVTALLLALGQGILSVGESLAAWLNGIKSMTLAVVILLLAWSIASVTSDLSTRDFMGAVLSEGLDPALLPALVFVLASITAFATGSSWGTMGILFPLAVPFAFDLAGGAGSPDAAHRILLGAVSAVLAGAIFGDHCSPISDTTVLSSMASGCDHVDHVKTQLPYALVVAAVAIAVGYVPAGYGAPPLLCMALGGLLLAVLLRWAGRPAAD